ncbi:MAG: DsbA family protein [Sphingomicrobium sp.]
MSEKRGSAWLPAIVGGVIGSLMTAGLLFVVWPNLIGERLVRQALLAHPDILVATADALRDRQYAPTLAAQRSTIETPFGSSWKGAAKPDVVMVEFHDYACPYCKTSNPIVERLLSEDKGLRVVYRDLPILGPASVAAARVALTASKAGRFAQFHDAMYAGGRPSPETVASAARAAGVAPEPAADPQIEAEIKRNFQLAGQLGATGTPLFVIGDRVINSAVGYDTLKKAIADARARG